MGNFLNNQFDEFEMVFRKSFEYFQLEENSKLSDDLYDKFYEFHDHKIELEKEEQNINNHSRPLRIGVVGGFSTGKSSMINSLLGEEVLGVKLEPATAQITELSYGPKFEVLEVVQEPNKDLIYKEISLVDYKKNSTDRVGKNENLSHYLIRYPSNNLANFTIVDTPGFSSTSKRDDELTKKWIKELDLLIWIFDANKVGDKTEYEKIKELEGRAKIIGVINKIDTKPPGVRNKIKDEILNTNYLEDVFFYSSKKVLHDYHTSNSYTKTLSDLSDQINQEVQKSEKFDITYSNSDITFSTATETKTFVLKPIQSNSYTQYYEELLMKIDKVRNEEINIILNQSLVKKQDGFRENIIRELVNLKESLETDHSIKSIESDKLKELLNKSENVYNDLREVLYEKLGASFKVFYTKFFNDLCNRLFFKKEEESLFSKKVIFCMNDLKDNETKITVFISFSFHNFLKSSFKIYENLIKKSIYKSNTRLSKIESDKNHIIHKVVKDLVQSSVDGLYGYYRNFSSHLTESYLTDLEFHKNNIDLVVPDELLESIISKVLIDDLIQASVEYEISLEDKIKVLEERMKNIENIWVTIDELIGKIK